MTTPAKIRVFVSSAQKELEHERAAVAQLISVDPFLLKHCQTVLYDKEPPVGRPNPKAYLEYLGSCHIYLLIVDVEYGRPAGNLSATHEEYRLAQQTKLPTLVFIRGLDRKHDATRKIILRVFSDRVELASPGYPLKPLTLAKLRKGNYRPCSRNPLITQTLALLGHMEQRGTGFARMRDAMLDHGLDAPTFAQQDGYFVITFPGPNGDYDRIKIPAQVSLLVPASLEAQLSARQRNIAAMLAKGESLASRVCQQQFKGSGPAIYADFQTLMRLGIAKRVGAGRATRYVLRPQTESLTNH